MKRKIFLLVILLIIIHSTVIAKEITALQIMYVIKQIFPDAVNLEIFVSEKFWDEKKESVTRAVTVQQLKANIHIIKTAIDIGTSIKKINDGNILVVFDAEVLMDQKSRLYILSRCKEKKILLVTASREYSEAGALLGVLLNESEQIEIIVNLTHNEHLKDKFTAEFIQEKGITTVIQ